MDELSNLHPSGVFLRREALDHGYDDRDLLAARKDGVIARVRHGAYVNSAAWTAADAIGKHLFAADAVLLTHHGTVALSHTSAAAAHGLRLFDPDLSTVHVTRLAQGNGGIRTTGVSYHRGLIDPAEATQVDGRLVVPPVRAALETASIHDVERGLVVLDSVVDLEHGSVDDVHRAYAEMAHWPFTGKLQVTVRLVRKGAKSVGESRSRFLCFQYHLPAPELQFEIRDHHGRLLGVTDFAWPAYRLLGEFDGMIKYGRLLKPGQEPGDALTAEKEREDLLREVTGWMMIRIIWKQLYDGPGTAARIRAKMRQAA